MEVPDRKRSSYSSRKYHTRETRRWCSNSFVRTLTIRAVLRVTGATPKKHLRGPSSDTRDGTSTTFSDPDRGYLDKDTRMVDRRVGSSFGARPGSPPHTASRPRPTNVAPLKGGSTVVARAPSLPPSPQGLSHGNGDAPEGGPYGSCRPGGRPCPTRSRGLRRSIPLEHPPDAPRRGKPITSPFSRTRESKGREERLLKRRWVL